MNEKPASEFCPFHGLPLRIERDAEGEYLSCAACAASQNLAASKEPSDGV